MSLIEKNAGSAIAAGSKKKKKLALETLLPKLKAHTFAV